MSTTRRQKANKNNRTRKNGGKSFLSSFDDDLVTIAVPGKNNISCALCNQNLFQRRSVTFGKSKKQNIMMDLAGVGDGMAESLNDISLFAYFCNNCGNAIMVRDEKKSSFFGKSTNYPNCIVASRAAPSAPSPPPAAAAK